VSGSGKPELETLVSRCEFESVQNTPERCLVFFASENRFGLRFCCTRTEFLLSVCKKFLIYGVCRMFCNEGLFLFPHVSKIALWRVHFRDITWICKRNVKKNNYFSEAGPTNVSNRHQFQVRHQSQVVIVYRHQSQVVIVHEIEFFYECEILCWQVPKNVWSNIYCMCCGFVIYVCRLRLWQSVCRKRENYSLFCDSTQFKPSRVIMSVEKKIKLAQCSAPANWVAGSQWYCTHWKGQKR